jgi:hypothetical protein
MNRQTPKSKNWVRYYDERNILDEITDESVALILDEQLGDEILSPPYRKSSYPGARR